MKKPKLLEKPRPWGERALRIVFALLLVGACYQLLAQSTFAWRLRNDVPYGVGGLVFGLALLLGLLPLALGRRYVGAYLASGFAATALGAYWWTTIPWEEVVTETNFNLETPPGPWEYLMVASPMFLAAAYVALSRWSTLRADLLARGADRREASRAAATSFLVGVLVLVATTAFAGAFAGLLMMGLLSGGLPGAAVLSAPLAVVLALVVMAGALLAYGRRLAVRRRLRRPSSRGEGPASPERTRARRWPS